MVAPPLLAAPWRGAALAPVREPLSGLRSGIALPIEELEDDLWEERFPAHYLLLLERLNVYEHVKSSEEA